MTAVDVPAYAPDLFSEAAIADPYPHYRALRDLGPVVHLPGAGVHAVARYRDVRAVLADDATFRSGAGVGLNDVANELIRGTTLASDEPEHAHLRAVVAGRLTPRALRDQRAAIEAKADALVAGLLGRDVVDGVADIAQAMPMSVVPDFLGFPDDCRHRLLEWAGGAIEAMGPFSARTPAAAELAGELGGYATELVETRGLLPDSLGSDLLAAADRGEVAADRCPALLLDYFGPSLETTVSALGSALALFAAHPDQWDLLRADPSLVGGAFNEVIRLESPLRAFSRVAARDAEIDGVPVPAGTRVAVFYASANRDERHWGPTADSFDITRDNADHLALGYGVHGCAGQGLARLEVGAVLTRLAASVARLEPAGEPVRQVNSMLRAHAALPLHLITA
ncbi:cytochrome P450 [Blastococcus sp. SYSU D00820]